MRGTLAAIDKPVNPAGRGSARRTACRSAFGGLVLGVFTLWACQKSAPSGSSAAVGAGGSSAQDEYRRPAVLVAALGLSQGQTVAEVGAGGGYLTLHLARAVGPQGRVVATDVDAGALAALRKRAHELPQVETRLVLPEQAGLEGGALRSDLAGRGGAPCAAAGEVSGCAVCQPGPARTSHCQWAPRPARATGASGDSGPASARRGTRRSARPVRHRAAPASWP